MNNKFWDSPAWTMGHRQDNKPKMKNNSSGINPAPGSYNISSGGSKIGCKIGNSMRGAFGTGNSPGPGNYNISSKSGAPKITMGGKSGTGAFGSSYTPGPGNYNTTTEPRPGSGITIGAKYHSQVLNQEPGPGAYNSLSNQKSGVKIGTSKRSELGKNAINPGPGEYTYDKRPYSAAPKYGFGRSTRDGFKNQFNQPGPGQYDTKTFLRSGENGRTMGEKYNSKDNIDSNPGPGCYNYNSENKRPASGVKIGNAKRGQIGGNMTPGPGAYQNTHGKFGGTKFGNAQRSQLGNGTNPGPGAYDTVKSSYGGVTISGHKGKMKVEDYPGPGSYNPNEFNSKNRPKSANIGKSQRSGMLRAETPGPGQYYKYDQQNYKFAYTKQTRSKDFKKNQPGPGQYDIPITVPCAPHYLIDPNVYQSINQS